MLSRQIRFQPAEDTTIQILPRNFRIEEKIPRYWKLLVDYKRMF